MQHYILTLTCQDGPGIIHAVSGALLEVEANVLEQAQFTDQDTGMFAMRTRFEAPERDPQGIAAVLRERAARFDPVVVVRAEDARRRALIMVSRQDHCLVDLLYRYDIGELPVEIPLVVSNHEDCRALVEYYGLPFTVIPVTPFAQNCSVVWCERTGAGGILDPHRPVQPRAGDFRQAELRLVTEATRHRRDNARIPNAQTADPSTHFSIRPRPW